MENLIILIFVGFIAFIVIYIITIGIYMMSLRRKWRKEDRGALRAKLWPGGNWPEKWEKL